MVKSFIYRYWHDISIAAEAIITNKLKSALTALGILFGVAAVISMMAIGTGAKQEILEQIKLVGANNIIISPKSNSLEDGNESDNEKISARFSPGLLLTDVDAIKKLLPTVENISPEIVIDTYLTRKGKREQTKLHGVSSKYFDIYNLKIESGRNFNSYHQETAAPVCIISPYVSQVFFSETNPIGKYLKCGNIWLQVVGVVEKRQLMSASTKSSGKHTLSSDIFVLAKTILLRYKDRARITAGILEREASKANMRKYIEEESGTEVNEVAKPNVNQLDRIIVQVYTPEQVMPTTKILERVLQRRHNDVIDYQITVPELLLKQQQKTKDIFNIVLGAIASISLIVGGIGIMNIMLASVLERIKEIGTRMAIGARKTDIIVQFLAESVLISITGGFAGVLLGIILSKMITKFSGILTIVSPLSIIIAFGVSVSIGIIFGILPARRAAQQDPVVSLRN